MGGGVVGGAAREGKGGEGEREGGNDLTGRESNVGNERDDWRRG